jgi:capsular polysaccharide transport system permease protein
LIKSRNSWQIMADTIFALIMRELRSRYGEGRLGYFWALAVPAGQTVLMVLVFSSIGRASLSGVPVPLFMLVSLLPFKMFSKTLTQVSGAVDANKGLLSYRQVEPIDPVIARAILEFFHFLLVSVILVGCLAWLGFDVWPDRFLELILACFLLSMFAMGCGLILCSVSVYWDSASKVVSVLMTPMMIMSGVLFAASMIPEQYWHLLTWNPVFHALELVRDAWFKSYSTPAGEWSYLIESVVLSNSLGLMLYWRNRAGFIAT